MSTGEAYGWPSKGVRFHHQGVALLKDVRNLQKYCMIYIYIPCWELTYPLKVVTFEDDFPFPQVGYVNFLEGNI